MGVINMDLVRPVSYRVIVLVMQETGDFKIRGIIHRIW